MLLRRRVPAAPARQDSVGVLDLSFRNAAVAAAYEASLNSTRGDRCFFLGHLAFNAIFNLAAMSTMSREGQISAVAYSTVLAVQGLLLWHRQLWEARREELCLALRFAFSTAFAVGCKTWHIETAASQLQGDAAGSEPALRVLKLVLLGLGLAMGWWCAVCLQVGLRSNLLSLLASFAVLVPHSRHVCMALRHISGAAAANTVGLCTTAGGLPAGACAAGAGSALRMALCMPALAALQFVSIVVMPAYYFRGVEFEMRAVWLARRAVVDERAAPDAARYQQADTRVLAATARVYAAVATAFIAYAATLVALLYL